MCTSLNRNGEGPTAASPDADQVGSFRHANATLPILKIMTCGDRAFLLELAGVDEVLRYHASLQAADISGVVDLVPAARTILVQIDPAVTELRVVLGTVEKLQIVPRRGSDESPAVDIPIRYDGPDLTELSARLGVTPDEFIRRHSSQTWTVAFTGHAPGFGYLVGAGERFDVPRRQERRPEVPAGAVAMAGRFTGIYPRPSPGGWQVIGTTEVPVWNVERTPPALLSPGQQVRFIQED